jgi:hypothetical protein
MVRHVARIYHVYVRDGVGNVWSLLIRNVPFVRLFRSNDGDLRNKSCVLREPMSSKGTSSGVQSDGVCAWLAKDGFNVPLNDIWQKDISGFDQLERMHTHDTNDLTVNDWWRVGCDGNSLVIAVSSGI